MAHTHQGCYLTLRNWLHKTSSYSVVLGPTETKHNDSVRVKNQNTLEDNYNGAFHIAEIFMTLHTQGLFLLLTISLVLCHLFSLHTPVFMNLSSVILIWICPSIYWGLYVQYLFKYLFKIFFFTFSLCLTETRGKKGGCVRQQRSSYSSSFTLILASIFTLSQSLFLHPNMANLPFLLKASVVRGGRMSVTTCERH